MRNVLLIAGIALALCAPPLAANPIPGTPWGNVDLYADNEFEEFIWDHAPGLLSIYVVQVSGPTTRSTGVQFSAPKPACFTATYLSDTCPYAVVIGNSQTGVALAYGSCRSIPVHVLTMNFFAAGTTPQCCYYWVRPDPNVPSGEVEGSDCDFNVVYLSGGATIINPSPDGCPTAAEPSTWGKVKSLYSE